MKRQLLLLFTTVLGKCIVDVDKVSQEDTHDAFALCDGIINESKEAKPLCDAMDDVCTWEVDPTDSPKGSLYLIQAVIDFFKGGSAATPAEGIETSDTDAYMVSESHDKVGEEPDLSNNYVHGHAQSGTSGQGAHPDADMIDAPMVPDKSHGMDDTFTQLEEEIYHMPLSHAPSGMSGQGAHPDADMIDAPMVPEKSHGMDDTGAQPEEEIYHMPLSHAPSGMSGQGAHPDADMIDAPMVPDKSHGMDDTFTQLEEVIYHMPLSHAPSGMSGQGAH